MKKFFSVLISFLLCFFSFSVPVLGIKPDEPSYVAVVTTGTSVQKIEEFSSLAVAIGAASDNDVIEVFDHVTEVGPIYVPQNVHLTIVSGKKRESMLNWGKRTFVFTDETAPIRTVSRGAFQGSMFVIPDGSSLTVRRLVIDGCSRQNNSADGGLFRVQNGGMLNLFVGTALKNSVLSAADSRGGAVFAENGSSVSVNEAVFSGNCAASGDDIYADAFAELQVVQGTSAKIVRGSPDPCDENRDGAVDIRDLVCMKKIVASSTGQRDASDLARLRRRLLNTVG